MSVLLIKSTSYRRADILVRHKNTFFRYIILLNILHR